MLLVVVFTSGGGVVVMISPPKDIPHGGYPPNWIESVVQVSASFQIFSRGGDNLQRGI